MRTLSPDEITKLLNKDRPPTLPADSGGVTQWEGDSPATYPCEYCGHCEDPEHCVYGVQCPKCYVLPRQQCLNPNGGLVGLHVERHVEAQSPFWREYVQPRS